MTESMYLVWSHEHSAWWGPNHCGYVRDVNRAGRYSRSEAIEIIEGATLDWSNPPNEVPVRVDDLPESARRPVVDGWQSGSDNILVARALDEPGMIAITVIDDLPEAARPVRKIHPNVGAMMKIALEKLFKDQNPTRTEINAALVDLVGKLQPAGEVKVEVDPDQPGALKVTGTGSAADWIREAKQGKP